MNKGWAGRTLSRQETAERLNPLIRRYYELNHQYDQTIRQINSREAASVLNGFQKTARVDIAKLSETVLSAGYPSYNGVDLDPKDFAQDGTDAELIDRLIAKEDEFGRLVADELDLEHQIRTRAILQLIRQNSQSRLDTLKTIRQRLGQEGRDNGR